VYRSAKAEGFTLGAEMNPKSSKAATVVCAKAEIRKENGF
jgi:hypothetical protein